MRKIIAIVVCMVVMIGCINTHGDNRKGWIVRTAEIWTTTQTQLSTYRCKPIDNTTWIVFEDYTGKFRVGDTLYITKH